MIPISGQLFERRKVFGPFDLMTGCRGQRERGKVDRLVRLMNIDWNRTRETPLVSGSSHQ
jgi:hypothetical protein